MNNKFAERLSEFLREEKISQRQFAATIGVTAACVSYWRSGKKQPTAELSRSSLIFTPRDAGFARVFRDREGNIQYARDHSMCDINKNHFKRR